MSRSYRRPYCKDGYRGSKHKQFAKKEANKKIRRSLEVPNGKIYRKFYDTWKICDYNFYQTQRDIQRHWPEWWRLIRK